MKLCESGVSGHMETHLKTIVSALIAWRIPLALAVKRWGRLQYFWAIRMLTMASTTDSLELFFVSMKYLITPNLPSDPNVIV